MTKRCDTLQEAFQYVSDTRVKDVAQGDQARLWSILVGPSGAHYVYFSDRNSGQQMHNIASLILNYRDQFQRAPLPQPPAQLLPAHSSLSLTALPQGVAPLPKLLRQESATALPPDNLHRDRAAVGEIANLLKERAENLGLTRWGGHAEEALIQDFQRVLQEEMKLHSAKNKASEERIER